MFSSVHAESMTHRIDAMLAGWNDQQAPGMAALVIRDGKVVYRKTFGLADLDTHRPITVNTQFLLASVTKQFTAMAIAILAEPTGAISIDSLASIIPNSPMVPRRSRSREELLHITICLPKYQELLVGKVDQRPYASRPRVWPAESI